MGIELGQVSRVLRRIALIAVFAAPYFTGQGVMASPTTEQASQFLPASQDVLDRLGIQRPQATDLTDLSLQVAR
jgi:hypothetical protein